MVVLRGSSIVWIIYFLNILGIICCVSCLLFCEKYIVWLFNFGVDFFEGESGRSWIVLFGIFFDCEVYKMEIVLWCLFCKFMYEVYVF